jgi:hypothetical protein
MAGTTALFAVGALVELAGTPYTQSVRAAKARKEQAAQLLATEAAVKDRAKRTWEHDSPLLVVDHANALRTTFEAERDRLQQWLFPVPYLIENEEVHVSVADAVRPYLTREGDPNALPRPLTVTDVHRACLSHSWRERVSAPLLRPAHHRAARSPLRGRAVRHGRHPPCARSRSSSP